MPHPELPVGFITLWGNQVSGGGGGDEMEKKGRILASVKNADVLRLNPCRSVNDNQYSLLGKKEPGLYRIVMMTPR